VHSSQLDKDEIRAYVQRQAHEVVVHLEKVASELVGPVRHDIWDMRVGADAVRIAPGARRMLRSRRSRLTLLLLMWNCSASSRAVVPAL
jgi:hypothetical protein